MHIIKKLILVLLALTLGFSAFAQKQKNSDLKTLKLNGQVKYIEEYSYADLNYDSKIGQNEIGSYEFTKFHKNCNIDAFLYRSKFLFFRYQYISMNEITQTVQFDEKGAIESMETYTYDKNGNKIEYIYYESGVVVSKTTYKYDSNNNNIENIAFKSNGEQGTRYLYQYDSLGNRTTSIHYLPSGELGGRTEFEYIAQSDEYWSISYKPNGEVEWQRKYKVDSKGNKIIEFKYNAKGELRDMWTWVYVYDKNNNWTKQTEHNEDGKVVKISTRKIVYYGDKDENSYPQWDNPTFKGRKI